MESKGVSRAVAVASLPGRMCTKLPPLQNCIYPPNLAAFGPRCWCHATRNGRISKVGEADCIRKQNAS